MGESSILKFDTADIFEGIFLDWNHTFCIIVMI